MVKKKGKKKAKKKSKPEPTGDETLELDGDGAQLGIGKKKKPKKAKLTKEEKAAAKVAKKLLEFANNQKEYEKFLDKANRWMLRSKEDVENLFKNFDREDDGVVPIDVFRAGLHDLLCPLTELEIHALTTILDPEDTGFIEYCGFEQGVHNRTTVGDDEYEEEVHEEEGGGGAGTRMTPDDYVPEIVTTKTGGKKTLPDPLHSDKPRFLKLNLRLATFDHVEKHPAHFQATVRTSMTVGTLTKLIGELGHVTTGQMMVFENKECEKQHCLQPSRFLWECGFQGGPEHDPRAVTLYYDYVIEYSDCPLLNCDHYFGQEKRPANPVLKAYPPRPRRARVESS